MLNCNEAKMIQPPQSTDNRSNVRSSYELGQPIYIQPNPCLFCIYCESANHSTHECERFNNSMKYWERISLDRRCKNCLRLYHRSNKCYDRSFCFLNTCKRYDKHSPTLCHARYVKYHNSYGHNYFKENSRFRGISTHQKFWPSKMNYILPITRSYEHSPRYNFPRKQKTYKFKSDDKITNYTSAIFKSTSQNQTCQTEICPPSSPGLNVATQTSEMKLSRDLSIKRSKSIGCQTESCQVDVSVQTRVIIPASQRIYNDIPAGMVDKVDVKSIGYVIKRDEKMIDSDIDKKDEKMITHDNTNKEEKIITCDSYPSKMNISTAIHSSSTNQRGTENQMCYPHSTQSSIDPYISLTNAVAKAKDQAIKGFRNFPHWK